MSLNLNSSKDFQTAKLFVVTIRQFFASTSLHGFKYLIKQGISAFEKYGEKKFVLLFFRVDFMEFHQIDIG